MNQLNNLFKKKLAEQQFEGKEKYWAALDKKLTEHAQEKVVIAWYKKWLLPVVAVVSISIAALLYTNIDTPATTTGVEKTHVSEPPASSAQSQNNSEVNSSTDAVVNNQSESNTSQITDANPVRPVTANHVNNSLKESSNQIGSNESKTLAPTILNSKNQHLPADSKAEQLLTASKEPQLSNSDSEEPAQQQSIVVNSPLNPALNQNPTTLTQNTENQIKAENEHSLDFSQIIMPLALLAPKALSSITYPESNALITSQLIPESKTKVKNTMSISIYGGAMYSIKHLKTSEGNTAEYLNRRKQEEENTINPNLGLDFELKRGHWTMSSGLNFHQQGEQRNYSDQFHRTIPYDSLVININNNSAWLIDSTEFYALQYSSIITSNDTTVTYYDENSGLFYTAQVPGNLTQSTLIDTNFYYQVDSTYIQSIDTIKTNYSLSKHAIINDPNQPNLKGKNTFSYVELPLLIGYEWGVKRWRLSLKGGIGLGVLTRQQSYYLTLDDAEVAPVSTSVYTKIMYNAIIRAGLHYNFTPQMGIDIVPFSRVNINNMTNKSAPFQQKYTNIGLQVGVSYKLN